MKTLPVALAFGLFGALAVTVSSSLQWPTWVMFIAWVSFYVFGRTWKSSLSTFLHMIAGIIMGVLIQISGRFLAGMLGPLGFPLAVFFFIGSLAYFSRSRNLNNLPAWFMGLIILFGVHPPLEPQPIAELLIPITAGFVFAWLNYKVVEVVYARQQHTS